MSSGPSIPSNAAVSVAASTSSATIPNETRQPPTIHARPFIRGPSLLPDRSRQLVKPDDQTEEQATHQPPGPGAAPRIERVADAAEEQNRANQAVAGRRRRSRLLDRVLE